MPPQPPPQRSKPRPYRLAALCASFLAISWYLSRNAPASRPPVALSLRGNKTFLILAASGDVSFMPRWLEGFERSTWDIVWLYFGDRTVSCPQCIAVQHEKGPKLQLALKFMRTQAWAQIVKQYKVVYLPDDDIVMDVDSINAAFEVFSLFQLQLAQQSVCRHPNAYTFFGPLYQQEGSVLRFTSHLEVMAPMFDMAVFDTTVRETLPDAFYGWGTGLIWPFLLGYPRDKVAVIDLTCMGHPKAPPRALAKEGPRQRIYSLKAGSVAGGRGHKQEKQHFLAKYGLNKTVAQALGLPSLRTTFSSVPISEAEKRFQGRPALERWRDHRQPRELDALMEPDPAAARGKRGQEDGEESGEPGEEGEVEGELEGGEQPGS